MFNIKGLEKLDDETYTEVLKQIQKLSRNSYGLGIVAGIGLTIAASSIILIKRTKNLQKLNEE